MLLILTIAGTKKSVTAKFAVTLSSRIAVTGLILQTQIITPKKVTVTDKICFLLVLSQFRGNFINKHSYNYIFISLIFS